MYETESDDVRTIKGLPLWQATIAALLFPIIIAIVFGLLGAKSNPLLMQVELLLVIIAFCLTGILTRSKLMGLLTIVTAPISWLGLFLLTIISGGIIPNPFGLFTGLSEPVTALLENSSLEIAPETRELVNFLIQAAPIVDLLFVELLAFMLGFLLAAIATGFWTKKEGKLSIFSVIMKPIAAILVILILVTIPFIYHGVANFTDGGISMVAGAAEFMNAFGMLGGSGAQTGNLDLNDPTVLASLIAASEKAQELFKRSALAFDQVQGNFLASLLIDALFPEGTNYGGLNMQQLPLILDISEILADISRELPYLLLGFNAFVTGFDKTFSILGESDIGGGTGGSLSSSYDPDYQLGLGNISTAINYFNLSKAGVLNALATAKNIFNQVVTGDVGTLNIIGDILDELEIGYGIILEVAYGAVYFLNATYKTTLAIEDLGDSDFTSAHTWMDAAAGDLVLANTTMSTIDTSGLNPDSPIPFWGIIEIIKDMTNLLTWFTLAAANSTQAYTYIKDVLVEINELNFSSSEILTYDFGPLSTNVSIADSSFQAAKYNIDQATSLSSTLSGKSYGAMADGSLSSMLEEFTIMLSQFNGNVTAVGHLTTALAETVYSVESFTTGFALFNQSYSEARYNANITADNETHESELFFTYFSSDTRVNQSEEMMIYSIANASNAWSAVGSAEYISNTVKTKWQRNLYYPSPPVEPDPEAIPRSIAGLAQGIYTSIAALKAAANLVEAGGYASLIQDFFEYMDSIDLADIFSGGS